MIALSGYSGASVFGLNSHAWTRSLNFEILRSVPSAASLSMMSQPVSMRQRAEARAAAQEHAPRRIGQELGRILDQQLRIDAGNDLADAGHGCS